MLRENGEYSDGNEFDHDDILRYFSYLRWNKNYCCFRAKYGDRRCQMEGLINTFVSPITHLCQIINDGFTRIVITGGYFVDDGMEHTQTVLEVTNNI